MCVRAGFYSRSWRNLLFTQLSGDPVAIELFLPHRIEVGIVVARKIVLTDGKAGLLFRKLFFNGFSGHGLILFFFTMPDQAQMFHEHFTVPYRIPCEAIEDHDEDGSGEPLKFTFQSPGSCSGSLRFGFGAGKPSIDPQYVDQQQDRVLNDQRAFVLKPAIEHPGNRGQDEECEPGNSKTRIPIGGNHRRRQDSHGCSGAA